MAMSAGSEDSLWITDQNVLQEVKIEGKILKIVAQKDIEIDGMAFLHPTISFWLKEID